MPMNDITLKERREAAIYRKIAAALMLAGWSIGLVNLMGWARI